MIRRLDIDLIVERADKGWALRTGSEASEPARLAAIARSVQDHVHLHVLDHLEVEIGILRAQVARLVGAAVGEWVPDAPSEPQVSAALRELRAVEAFLQSLNQDQKGAA
jgi:hypothetical protein